LKHSLTVLIATIFAFSLSVPAWAHHNSPEEIYDFITDQLTLVDSPHLLSSEDDPSLLEVYTATTLEDVDQVLVLDDLSATELQAFLDAVLEQLATENEVCGTDYDILYDMTTDTFTLIIYVDYCTQ